MSTGNGATYYDGSAGGIAGYASGTTFTNLQVQGNFSVDFDGSSGLSVGGIAGSADDVTITACRVTGAVGGISANYLTIGGIAGMISNSAGSKGISGSSFIGTIDGNAPDGNAEAGGIAGSVNNGDIAACFAEAVEIQAEADSPKVGGIAGVIEGGSIKKSYATGEIKSIAAGWLSEAGGIAGWLQAGSIENCYALADVSVSSVYNSADPLSKENAGGIAGSNGGTISKCYAAGTVKANGQNTTSVGGIAGNTNAQIGGCMALVEELDGALTTPSSHTRNVYAIGNSTASFSTGTGNYSRNDITYNNYTNTSFDFGANGKGGQQKPAADFESQAAYTTALWNFTDGTGDWKFLGSGYDYPVLFWQTAEPGTDLEEASKVNFEMVIEWP
jgi:hypothetical protein